jgi:hypothetical protein
MHGKGRITAFCLVKNLCHALFVTCTTKAFAGAWKKNGNSMTDGAYRSPANFTNVCCASPIGTHDKQNLKKRKNKHNRGPPLRATTTLAAGSGLLASATRAGEEESSTTPTE